MAVTIWRKTAKVIKLVAWNCCCLLKVPAHLVKNLRFPALSFGKQSKLFWLVVGAVSLLSVAVGKVNYPPAELKHREGKVPAALLSQP